MKSVTTSAPGRCGIIGNPSDIYGGTVVSCSVGVRNYCTVTLSESHDWPEDNRLIRAALSAEGFDQPIKVEWTSEVPRNSGLSGSTAALASLILALRALKGEDCNLESLEVKSKFAEDVRRCERFDAGIMCGFQDAYMISHGFMQLMNFTGKGPEMTRERSGQPHATLTQIQSDLQFLLITTGVERLSGAVHAPLTERWIQGEMLVRDGIARIAELGREGQVAIEASDSGCLAELMQENHEIVKEFGASGKEVDDLVQHCLNEGALAAKLAGAGLGGTVIALCDSPNELQNRLSRRGYTRFLLPLPCPGVRIETQSVR